MEIIEKSDSRLVVKAPFSRLGIFWGFSMLAIALGMRFDSFVSASKFSYLMELLLLILSIILFLYNGNSTLCIDKPSGLILIEKRWCFNTKLIKKSMAINDLVAFRFISSHIRGGWKGECIFEGARSTIVFKINRAHFLGYIKGWLLDQTQEAIYAKEISDFLGMSAVEWKSLPLPGSSE